MVSKFLSVATSSEQCYSMIVNTTVYQGENFVLTNEHVLRQAAAEPNLQTVLVLVPDRFTLQAERIMLKQQPHLLNIRVVTFSMLYRLVASELTRGEEPVILDKTSAVLNLWNAIREVQDQLLWFKSSAAHYDFAEKLYNTINQMRSSCVDFGALELQTQNPVSQKKYHDINLIYQTYRRKIAAQTDSLDMLSYLTANIEKSLTIKNASIFICGFASLSPARLQVVHALCACAGKVIIAASEPELRAQLPQFKPCILEAVHSFQPQLITGRCETERGEANVIMQKIAILLNQGVSPDDIVVLLNEFDMTAPIWQVVAEQYKVPVNIDVGTKLSNMVETKYLRDLLALAINDNAENSIATLFNQCSGVEDETIFTLDNQIIKANLRARAIPEIKKLSAVQNINELCAELKTFTENEKIHYILDQISQGYESQPLNLREFMNLFWTLCSATKVSKIPQYIDRVLIAPVNDWVPTKIKYLFIANCTADNFPQTQPDDDLLQEADLVGTQITPTPTLQRRRNYRRAELLKSIASTQVLLSGTNEEFIPLPYQSYHSFRWGTDDQSSITVGQELFFPHRRVKTTLIESYYNCPRLNFYEKGLRLQPRPLYQLQANTVGSAIHMALQEYFKDHNLERAVKAGIQQLEYDYPPLTKNIEKEIKFILHELDQIYAEGGFDTQRTQVEKEVTRTLKSGLTLVGRVDRIDIGKDTNAFLVLDYKTGNVASGLAKNISLGNKLQLPVYAGTLACDGLGAIAGAGYLPLSKGYAADQKKFMFQGFIDKELANLFPPKMINTKARYYVDAQTIHNICDYALQMVDAAVDKIVNGSVEANAVAKGTCEFCSMKALCQHAMGPYRGDGVTVTYKDFGGEDTHDKE